ncbi:MAG: hypothetical protein VKK59_02205 [Vampirovibrionales bacterium]|nr:hypothetical protein [Vampirovibrionales bacterium]
MLAWMNAFWREHTFRLRTASGQLNPEPKRVRPIQEPQQVSEWLMRDPEARALTEKYALLAALKSMSLARAQLTLTKLSIFETAFQQRPFVAENTLKALDVGCKNWEDLFGFASFLQALTLLPSADTPGDATLDGVEVDAYRRYVDGSRRIDHASAAMLALGMSEHHQAVAAQYHAKNICELSVGTNIEPYDLIGWFLPFVVQEPLIAWGLPDRLFQPRQTLQHVISLLKPQGAMIITNQGDEEASIQKTLLHECSDIEFEAIALPKPFYPYRHTHRGWMCWKTA